LKDNLTFCQKKDNRAEFSELPAFPSCFQIRTLVNKKKTSVHHRGLFAKGDEACPTLCGSIIKTCKHVFATFALREIPAFAGMTSSLGGEAAIIGLKPIT